MAAGPPCLQSPCKVRGWSVAAHETVSAANGLSETQTNANTHAHQPCRQIYLYMVHRVIHVCIY